MISLQSFRNFTGGLNEQDHKMPVLFIGHGSPINGIEDNAFSRRWAQMVMGSLTMTSIKIG